MAVPGALQPTVTTATSFHHNVRASGRAECQASAPSVVACLRRRGVIVDGAEGHFWLPGPWPQSSRADLLCDALLISLIACSISKSRTGKRLQLWWPAALLQVLP